ncbi:hypothetical protein UFOVP787_190 [uncultured Caudovirales phage]|uniref:Uncharacterized protein n=1 Tax=uncultured Caudovirales phage TaxID=2100421 RepID=A0A6J5P0R4_9CAUD|nr:hypothetical protein UFOVP787_190 [uncultured Caudovirales phage]
MLIEIEGASSGKVIINTNQITVVEEPRFHHTTSKYYYALKIHVGDQEVIVQGPEADRVFQQLRDLVILGK